MLGVVEHHDGLLAAGLAVRAEQRAQLAQQRVSRRQSVGRGAGRAGGGALAAAGADVRIDRDMIAVRRYRAGRTEIEAAAAADDLRARMRAQVFGEINVARLVEGAGEIARLEHRAQHRSRIARIGAQITVAQIGGRKQRRAAGKINQYVAARHRAIARLAEFKRAARGRAWRGIIVDRHFERAEMALGRANGALHHRELGHPRRRDVGFRLDQHGDVEMVFEQIGGFDHLLVFAIEERDAFAVRPNERKVRYRLRASRDQRCHFWAQLWPRLSTSRPSREY